MPQLRFDRREFALLMGTGPFLMRTGAASSGDYVGGLTDLSALKVGHFTSPRRPTGCTVVLAEEGATAGVDVRGSAPGTRETDLLSPLNSVRQIHAVILSGGSAFGLDTASGVVRFLEERGIGFPAGPVRVPIVPAAILFDLGLGDPSIRPDAAAGYEACRAANGEPVAEGNVGAGTGATVGKLMGSKRAMKGGLGSSGLRVGSLVVAALAAVNAIGDVVDPATGRILAGTLEEDRRSLADSSRLLRREDFRSGASPGENTTLAVVATNAAFDKSALTKIAQMAHDGFARAVRPVHMPFDGDTVFALSTGELPEADLGQVGALAAEVTAEAVVRAVLKTEGLPGFPSASDLGH